MNDISKVVQDNVTPFPTRNSTPITDELTRISNIVLQACPKDSTVSFSFDGLFHIHVDVRGREDVTIVEAILPTLDQGLFYGLTRASTPNHPFFHRVSALVAG